jgi:hypothetical protein
MKNYRLIYRNKIFYLAILYLCQDINTITRIIQHTLITLLIILIHLIVNQEIQTIHVKNALNIAVKSAKKKINQKNVLINAISVVNLNHLVAKNVKKPLKKKRKKKNLATMNHIVVKNVKKLLKKKRKKRKKRNLAKLNHHLNVTLVKKMVKPLS